MERGLKSLMQINCDKKIYKAKMEDSLEADGSGANGHDTTTTVGPDRGANAGLNDSLKKYVSVNRQTVGANLELTTTTWHDLCDSNLMEHINKIINLIFI